MDNFPNLFKLLNIFVFSYHLRLSKNLSNLLMCSNIAGEYINIYCLLYWPVKQLRWILFYFFSSKTKVVLCRSLTFTEIHWTNNLLSDFISNIASGSTDLLGIAVSYNYMACACAVSAWAPWCILSTLAQ